MKLYNSYTLKTEEFKSIKPGEVSMYVCGPTVYDHPHLGHARCYITWDVVYRYLKFKGFDVVQLINPDLHQSNYYENMEPFQSYCMKG